MENIKNKLIDYIEFLYPEESPEKELFILTTAFSRNKDGNFTVVNYYDNAYEISYFEDVQLSDKTYMYIYYDMGEGAKMFLTSIFSIKNNKGKSTNNIIYAIDLFDNIKIKHYKGMIVLKISSDIIEVCNKIN